jgi:hypothetical protein
MITLMLLAASVAPVVWEGRTSQDRPFGFEVEGTAITKITYDYSLPLETPCPSSPGSALVLTSLGEEGWRAFPTTGPRSEIKGGRFEVTWSTPGSTATTAFNVVGTVEGSRASGDLRLTASGACAGTTTLTWTATRSEGGPSAATKAVGRPKLTSGLLQRMLDAKMTEAAATDLLGPAKPSNRPGVPSDMKELVWEDGGDSIMVQFRDGRATGGSLRTRQ